MLNDTFICIHTMPDQFHFLMVFVCFGDLATSTTDENEQEKIRIFLKQLKGKLSYIDNIIEQIMRNTYNPIFFRWLMKTQIY